MKKLSFIFLLFALSCTSTNDKSSPTPSAIPSDEHLISIEEANNIALNASITQNEKSRIQGNEKPKTVKNQITVDDDDDKTKKTATSPVFYIFNYEEGGYSIISADDRISSVLAIVEKGPGIEKNTELPGGLLLWMQAQKKQIQDIRKGNLGKGSTKNGRITSTVIAQVPPLLSTTWGQWSGYNTYVPLNCSSTWYNGGKAPIGCVATAMAQVMKKWQYPATSNYVNYYDWSNMNGGTPSTATLMIQAAQSVNMQWGCGGSGASSTSIAPALRNTFHYSSATYNSSYNVNDVVNNLNIGQPVLLGGCDSYGSFLFWTWGNGNCHEWVCDGYIYQVDYHVWGGYDSRTERTWYYDKYSYLLHMNWGWDGGHNGWFLSTYFGSDVNGNANAYNFQYALDEVINIHP